MGWNLVRYKEINVRENLRRNEKKDNLDELLILDIQDDDK
jgi:hypothetical protein